MANAAEAQRFRQAVALALRNRPLATPKGVVPDELMPALFGFPGGDLGEADYWVYRRSHTPLEMLFAFQDVYYPDYLVCKVRSSGEPVAPGEGATLEMNPRTCVTELGPDEYELRHTGDVTVVSRLSRDDLLNAIREAAPVVPGLLGLSDFPIAPGRTSNIGELIDRLFVYSYGVEQAKRWIRGTPPLPALTR